MRTIKFILYFQFLALLVTGFVHLAFFLLGKVFPLATYPIAAFFILVVTLFVWCILFPILEKLIDL